MYSRIIEELLENCFENSFKNRHTYKETFKIISKGIFQKIVERKIYWGCARELLISKDLWLERDIKNEE